MARLDIEQYDATTIGIVGQADRLFDLGLACATGRDGAIDMVSAHKWFNIAASKGSAAAAERRTEIASMLTKDELAAALRDARKWMTLH
ncbi:sel1 repeat family protein [Notoacmeibacter sp. MSK16QG-6]|uniref:sel1 repeat family protein n=1 Tax=Notoacmeibacter sp. MSK16QG-6 TaxID=2957982 RepID=UPI00209F200B|nr:sel1 repeat family protein [Notoacmeibacter sp. MSK16QG-6]MCP1198099.1 sel1 repeat family protein [Notoacmeibacter sp. MSK16QG-6]